jgi:long-subunit fatty acid transport protein
LGLDDPDNDVDVEAKVADWATPGFVIGALIDPHPKVTIGFSATAQQNFGAKGTGSIDLSNNSLADLIDPDLFTDDIVLNQVLPWEIRAGVAVRPIEKLEIEAAYVWQDWSKVTEILIEDIDVEIDVPFLGPQKVPESISLPAGLKDTHSFRLGAEWDVADPIVLRVGGFYETGSITTQKLSPALVDPWKVQLGGGGTVRLLQKRLQLDFAVAAVILPTVDVTDSEVTLINVLCQPGEPCNQAVVGNGKYESTGLIFGGNARWEFNGAGKRLREARKARATAAEAEVPEPEAAAPAVAELPPVEAEPSGG